jgi:hypothetical protein
MTITYPRTLPTVGKCLHSSLKMVHLQEINPTRGGMPISRTFGASLWSGNYSFLIDARADYEQWLAWFDSLRGSQYAFWVGDYFRQRPKAHMLSWPSGVTGNLTIASVGNNGRTLTLGSAGVGLSLQVGDMLAFDFATPSRRAYHKVVSAAISSGGAITVDVVPAVRPGWAVGVVVALNTPQALMVLQGEPDIGEWHNRQARVSFATIQVP